jgi:hypothetical protein
VSQEAYPALLVALHGWRANIHAGCGDAFKYPFVSFPRKRESMLTLKGQMDSRFHGNERLALGHKKKRGAVSKSRYMFMNSFGLLIAFT